ncbi:protein of unknown function [Blastococcus aggregatus]|uniref:HNH nuclease domain-containing protein n=1 Tax=Blastococcus aggregatus TaxID=38502 RepID=A0A285V531_9ACTN|nr:HNH endonuclease signature motif containing protein [Blastococcus aggregatus]SOC49169.1 protein of unknown function [Blastococcus aggregatus]
MPRIEVQRSSLEGVLLELAPMVEHVSADRLSAEEAVRALASLQERKAKDDAREAELLMALAADRPDTDDPPPGHPGARRRSAGSPVPGTSEFLPDEVALVLNCGRPFATDLLSDAYQLVERMPAVHAARAAGRLDGYRARIFADVLGTASDEVIAVVVPKVLPSAAGWSSGTLRKRLIAAAIATDEEFAEQRRIEAERRAAVRLYPTADGMSALTTEAPAAVTAAMWSVIDQAAQLAKTAGDDRPIGVLRAEAHAARVLGAQHDGPAMTGHVTIIAPLSALHAPGHEATHPGASAPQACPEDSVPTVGGTPITSAHLRELLAQLDALGVQAPPGGSLTLALTDDDGALLATVTPAELARLAARGCGEHGKAADCGCSVLGPPPEVPGYSHTAEQERFLRLRDRTCRHPGCGQPAGRTDADHVVAYDCGGRTACDNLCCLCRSHHRLKTFARGWRFRLDPDGTLHVTTPSGITRSTRPPGLREQRALPPPRPGPVDDDPPPF